MSINVSGRQLLEVDEIDELLRIISEAGLRNADIKLKITESLMVQDPAYAAMAFRKLKREGVRLARPSTISAPAIRASAISTANRWIR